MRPPFAAGRSRLSKSSPGWGGPSAEHTSCSIFRLRGGDGHSLASARYGRQEVRRRRAAAVSATSPQESSRRRGPAAAMGGPPISRREDETAIDDWAARGRAGGRAGSRSGVRTLPSSQLQSNAVGESQQISLICGLNLGWCGRARPGRRSVGCPADSLRCPCRKVREPPPLFQVEVRRAH